jgi:uncharacterized oligopeptide transporter (OPT) family protein
MSNGGSEHPGFTLRAAAVAVGLTLFLLTSSSYMAIKIGAQPWPIIFSVIVSGGILKLLSGAKNVSVHEINTAQAGASIGGLVAAGVVFTVPGILYLNQTQNLNIAWPSPWRLGLITTAAGLLGILLSIPLKIYFCRSGATPLSLRHSRGRAIEVGKDGRLATFSYLDYRLCRRHFRFAARSVFARRN